MRSPIGGALVALLGFAGSAAAHFNMLLPQTSTAKKSETLIFTYQWGHPFEHQLFDAPQPLSLTVRAPDGKKTEIVRDLRKVTRKGESKEVSAYQFRFTPEQRGDYLFVLQTPPIWMQDESEFFQDTVKVVLHVQAQRGWDAAIADDFEFAPLTRPYGLRPGMVFQAMIANSDKERASRGGNLVEIERYNVAPPAMLPPDEQITRTVRTDPNGVTTTTLTESGWWCLTAARIRGTKEREGKAYPLRQRATLWVFVDDVDRGK